MGHTNGLGQWLEERCKEEHLSLRQAAAKTGLSHATISAIINGGRPSADTIQKLAQSFGGDGTERLALEDQLLILAGHRTRHRDAEISQPLARLMDQVAHFSEPQLKLMSAFARFLAETEKK